MAREIIAHEFNDWSPIVSEDELWDSLDLSDPELNFGIHTYNDRLWTSGYVGVGRLFDRRRRPIVTNGREHIAVISSRYGMDPWKMLETVMMDEEYESYCSELETGEFLFKVFYDQPLIRLAQDDQNDGDLLYAISFINACYELCRKGLKKALLRREENLQAKIRGTISVKKNIRENTARGRNDRFYCQYIDFTVDTTENRILKATLLKCRTILHSRFEISAEMAQRIGFCMNAFRRVKTVSITARDFTTASASGLYTYYKPLLRQASCILRQKYFSFRAENGQTVTRSVYTVPYMINMERLFEFYVRTILKRRIDADRYYLEPYSHKLFLQHNVTRIEDAEKRVHLMAYCIPDVIIRSRQTQAPVLVLDAKYKSHTRTARADSHQLLAYALLTNAPKCGFVFPGTATSVKLMESGENHLRIAGGNIQYYELILGNEAAAACLEPLFD